MVTPITPAVEEEPEVRYKIIHTEKEIQQRVKDIAEQISGMARPDDIFICLLRGGVFFYSDLMKQLCLHGLSGLRLHFLDVRTDKDITGKSTACVYDFILDGNMYGQLREGANVWIVDDIMDSGRSATTVINWFEDICKGKGFHKPEYNTVMMLERVGAYHDPRIKHHIAGFIESRKEWFVGYGMDGSNGDLRAIPAIAIEMSDVLDVNN